MKQFRRGYLGHVTRIANFIQKTFEEDFELRGYIDQQKWQVLRETFLDKTNEANNKNLDNYHLMECNNSPKYDHYSSNFDVTASKND